MGQRRQYHRIDEGVSGSLVAPNMFGATAANDQAHSSKQVFFSSSTVTVIAPLTSKIATK